MKAGFAKTDITPRVGVELCGFGPFLCRHSIAVRDRLWARAMAVSDGNKTCVVVSCDLIGLVAETVRKVRDLVRTETKLAADEIMVHCTHTHSGPATLNLIGWGQMDYPYMEILPGRIADACKRAIHNLVEAKLFHAEVPCEGIGLNREYDKDAPPLEDVLRDDWRPAKPELTDTTCHVVKAVNHEGKMIGFCSYFGCHPVVCCQTTRYIHGDYAGVATNMLERENPGSVGLFLQGAQGDVNSCVVHKPEPEALLALDVIAARYANNVRRGLNAAMPLADSELRSVSKKVEISRIPISQEQLLTWLREKEAVVQTANASDLADDVRFAAVYIQSIRSMLAEMDAGQDMTPPAEVQGIRIGDISLLASPFETFQAIKNDVVKNASAKIPLVMGLTNDLWGYAPDRTVAARGGYAAQIVPVMLGRLPYANIHEELVHHLLAVDHELSFCL
jgi:hypothetical protein